MDYGEVGHITSSAVQAEESLLCNMHLLCLLSQYQVTPLRHSHSPSCLRAHRLKLPLGLWFQFRLTISRKILKSSSVPQCPQGPSSCQVVRSRLLRVLKNVSTKATEPYWLSAHPAISVKTGYHPLMKTAYTPSTSYHMARYVGLQPHHFCNVI